MMNFPGLKSISSGSSSEMSEALPAYEAAMSPEAAAKISQFRRGRSSSVPNMLHLGGTPQTRGNNGSFGPSPEHSLSPGANAPETPVPPPPKTRSRASMSATAVPSVTVTWGEDGKVEQLGVSAEGTRFEQHLPVFVNRQCRVTQRKVEMINRNWRFVLKGTPALTEYQAGHPDATAITFFYDTFYSELFAKSPEMRPLFHSSMAVQGRALISMVAQLTNIAVVSPGQTYQSEVIPAIQGLAERHLEYGITPTHFTTMGQVLLFALEKCTGATGWTPAIADAWLEVFSFLCLIMVPRVVIKMEEAARASESSPHRLNPLNLLGLGQRRASNSKESGGSGPSGAAGEPSGSSSRRGSRDPSTSPPPNLFGTGSGNGSFLATSPPTLAGRRRWSLSGIDLQGQQPQQQQREPPSPSLHESSTFPREEHWQEGAHNRPSRWRKIGAAIAKTLAGHSLSPNNGGSSNNHRTSPASVGPHFQYQNGGRHHRNCLSQTMPAPRTSGTNRGRSNSGGRVGDLGTPGTRSPNDMGRMDWDADSRGCGGDVDVESIASELRHPPFMVLHSKPEAIIAPGLTLKGELKFKSFLRVDGRFEGQVLCNSGSLGCLVIGPSGVVVGDVKGLNEVMIEGRLEGDVAAATVLLKGNAVVQGAITASILQVDPGVRIKGSVSISSPRTTSNAPALPPRPEGGTPRNAGSGSSSSGGGGGSSKAFAEAGSEPKARGAAAFEALGASAPGAVSSTLAGA